MAAGLEVAGLALAIFPVVTQMVDWYSGVFTGRDVKLLAESLKNNEHMFRNSLEYLLRSTVPPAKLSLLLNNLEGEAWKEKSLGESVTDHLGQEAANILENVEDIYKTLAKLREKLPAPPKNGTTDVSIQARAKLVLKSFVYGKHNKASLERLKIRISEFRKLTKDSIKLASARNPLPKALQGLDLVQECAKGLYDALQARWKCHCNQLHPANIQLDIWSVRAQEGESDTVRLKFSFLFADDAEHAQHGHWMTAEITVSKLGPDGGQSLALGSLGASLADVLTSISSSGPSVSTHAIAPNISATLSSSAQSTQAVANDDIKDLCSILKMPGRPPQAARRRVGSMSDSNGHNYQLFSTPDPATTKTSLKLADSFGQHGVLSNKARVQLALMLAWGVLQISSTGWLKGKWSKDNILLVMDDAASKPLPYISHRFQSSHDSPCDSEASTLAPTISNQIAAWVTNASLFALGVFMLEVCYNRSIEDLATVGEKNAGSPYTQFLTAMRLSKLVQDELGVSYARAIRACLHAQSFDMDADGKPKDPLAFAKGVMRDIIDPLKNVENTFG